MFGSSRLFLRALLQFIQASKREGGLVNMENHSVLVVNMDILPRRTKTSAPTMRLYSGKVCVA